MLESIKENLWKQFGASIDMLKNAIAFCPEDYWIANEKLFYHAYHCLIFLDYYLTIPCKDFTSPLPFTITEPENMPQGAIDDLVPNKIYSRNELLDYLQASRNKCHQLIAGLTEDKLNEIWVDEEGDRSYPFFELLLYNMRHVQHHAAQMNLLLRQGINDAPKWVRRAM